MPNHTHWQLTVLPDDWTCYTRRQILHRSRSGQPFDHTELMTAWPQFMREDEITHARWSEFVDDFQDDHLYLFDAQGDLLMRVENVSLYWEDPLEALPATGWEWAINAGIAGNQAGIAPNLMIAIAITIPPRRQGGRLSAIGLRLMKDIARQKGFKALAAPVRPTLKSAYPLMPMEQFMHWRRDDGLLVDPWLRTHERQGATLLKVAPESMRITGSRADWSAWTGLSFPYSGAYIVPGALTPVQVDAQADQVVYIEPNVWMYHLL